MVFDAQNYYFFATWHNIFSTSSKKIPTFAISKTIKLLRIMTLNGILALLMPSKGEIIIVLIGLILIIMGLLSLFRRKKE